MLNSEDIKKMAKAMGADAVGIGNIERWEGAPTQMDPRQIMPEARSVIAMAFRVMRGSLRGIEEGTFFSNYSAMGYGGITYLYMPMTVINLSKMIEDDGFEAVPMGHQSDWRMIDNEGFGRLSSRPVAPGRAAPDVMIHLRIAAFLCGLGEIGYSKMLLTPQFGPRQRVGIIITDAELEPDPLYPDTDGPQLCNRCMACVKDCPGEAISPTDTIKVTLAGHEVEWADIDCKACSIAFRGGLETEEPLSENDQYMPSTFGKNVARSPWTPFVKKPRNLYNTGQAVCGARGCTRACMITLESRGVLENKFKDKFRRRKPWTVDWSSEPEYPEDLIMHGDGPVPDPKVKPVD
ncbi:MAG: epoxyqueuosine reductase [Lentisphaerae bacterium]|jgi:epoxyqueuosine reductase|nr:epoxyqueuosine reductase [Lentisphaerota bacterium]MBT4823004.1 epoxyqueuosine reductase [Lentisphaerota bacterium]MBT5610429.1 epoxyqueuosine reductase [Lentisphaerota bacterium]MBT7053514.1 epoxyqueuosine reductase [Lentisphaerota bacterium]MBT7842730.1 epoxyqueuosine reductase [Lentisphaerota bacterium]